MPEQEDEDGEVFLYCTSHFHPAYFIVPANHPSFFTVCPGNENPVAQKIAHQYGCYGCMQWGEMGRVEEVPEPLASLLSEILDCGCETLAGRGSYRTRSTPLSIEHLSNQIGMEVEQILGEALIKLKDGRYIAVENCD